MAYNKILRDILGLGGQWVGDGVCRRVCWVRFLGYVMSMDGHGGTTVAKKGLSTGSVH